MTEIRLCTASEVPYILQFIRDLAEYEKELDKVEATVESLSIALGFTPPPASSATSDQTLFQPPWCKCLLAFVPEQPEPVGMALYFTTFSTWRSAPGIYLEDLYVDPKFRGRGLGKAFIRRLAKESLKIGGKRLEWCVLKWNKPSIEFYDLIGAKPMSEWQTMRVDGEVLEKLAGESK
ncbi:acyl-CoA N-acyltransferase [Ascobolus immersus RN42]|uniref:Acyl-CoA N-acyltransferase n=1 Tax=Ascobolus immersus RN42 TaxID=1160509 RepID=A0A3N4ITL2_ASCIM|nr:acyl-CoA N-acyltransferase [Ascobolus immersus RN42]